MHCSEQLSLKSWDVSKYPGDKFTKSLKSENLGICILNCPKRFKNEAQEIIKIITQFVIFNQKIIFLRFSKAKWDVRV